jgi:hypothetical protein
VLLPEDGSQHGNVYKKILNHYIYLCNLLVFVTINTVSSLVRQCKCYFRIPSQVNEITYHPENSFFIGKGARLLELLLYVHFFTPDLIIVFIAARYFG